MRQPSAHDQLMLELVNYARLNPQLEADRLLSGDLNQDIAGESLSSAPRQPLTFNLLLNESAFNHSQWMLDNDIFSHTGANNSTSNQRMREVGYEFIPSWGSGENIAWRGTTGAVDLTAFIISNHEGLFISVGHRVNILNENFQEVGISSLTGTFFSDDIDYNSVITTQNFAYSHNGGAFLTGVVYDDSINPDNFYTVGEGIAEINIIAENQSTGEIFTTTTWTSGGYSLPLPSGQYEVTMNGDGVEGAFARLIDIDQENIKLDYNTQEFPEDAVIPPSELLTTPIYRFQNLNQLGTYLYVGEEEKQNILGNFPEFKEEGLAFQVGVERGDDLIPLYRFHNNNAPGTYLYAGESETDYIRDNFSHFREEGIAFYVYGVGSNQGTPIYRFQNLNQLGTYLYVGEEEKQNILINFPNFQEEGLAFEVM